MASNTDPDEIKQKLSASLAFLAEVFDQCFADLCKHSPLSASQLELRLQAVRKIVEAGLSLAAAHNPCQELRSHQTPWKGEAWTTLEHLLASRAAYAEAREDYYQGHDLPIDNDVREKVIEAFARTDADTRSLVQAIGDTVCKGVASELTKAKSALEQVAGGDSQGRTWSDNVLANSTVDDLVDYAAGSVLKAPAGPVKRGEAEVRTLLEQLITAIISMGQPEDTNQLLRTEAEDLLLKVKGLKLEIKILKAMQKFPQKSKQQSSYKAFAKDYREDELAQHVHPLLWSEYDLARSECK